MNNNRIGTACWYRTFVTEGYVNKPLWKGGYLRAWGTDYEHLENGIGLVPVAVIEDEKTMCCLSTHVQNVCFASIPPSK